MSGTAHPRRREAVQRAGHAARLFSETPVPHPARCSKVLGVRTRVAAEGFAQSPPPLGDARRRPQRGTAPRSGRRISRSAAYTCPPAFATTHHEPRATRAVSSNFQISYSRLPTPECGARTQQSEVYGKKTRAPPRCATPPGLPRALAREPRIRRREKRERERRAPRAREAVPAAAAHAQPSARGVQQICRRRSPGCPPHPTRARPARTPNAARAPQAHGGDFPDGRLGRRWKGARRGKGRRGSFAGNTRRGGARPSRTPCASGLLSSVRGGDRPCVLPLPSWRRSADRDGARGGMSGRAKVRGRRGEIDGREVAKREKKTRWSGASAICRGGDQDKGTARERARPTTGRAAGRWTSERVEWGLPPCARPIPQEGRKRGACRQHRAPSPSPAAGDGRRPAREEAGASACRGRAIAHSRPSTQSSVTRPLAGVPKYAVRPRAHARKLSSGSLSRAGGGGHRDPVPLPYACAGRTTSVRPAREFDVPSSTQEKARAAGRAGGWAAA